MANVDPIATQRGMVADTPAELRNAGFDDVAEIGHGGFGVVYRCVQPILDRTIAVKVLTSDLDPDNLDRFMREQRAMGRLSGHPQIVQILEVGTTASGRPFIVMPYHAKDSLEALIRRHGPLDWRETLSIGVKLAGALDAAHRVGTLHRDVKPANILLTDYGEPQLTDFGIARIAGGFETATGIVIGSPAYIAPEVLEGQSPTPASDIYSLGASLFCALTGHTAFERRSDERIVAQFLRMTTKPSAQLDLHRIPDDVAAAIDHAMASDPDDRPATAADFGNKLRHIQNRHGLTVDGMDVPPGGDGGGAHSAAAIHSPNTPASRVRVVLAEDVLLLREGLASLLQRSGFDVIGQAGDGSQLLAIVRETTPDLVVTDIRMPPDNFTEGLDAARVIREELPDTAVVVLSAHVDIEHAMELLASGHSIGYLLKSRVTDVADFVETLQRVAKGASVVDPALVQELVSARRRDDPLAVLTAREQEVLALMAEGRSNAGIAQRLWVTERTVEKHVRRILTKLNLPETGDAHRRVLAVIAFLEAH